MRTPFIVVVKEGNPSGCAGLRSNVPRRFSAQRSCVYYNLQTRVHNGTKPFDGFRIVSVNDNNNL
jgi:hypothetical protein